MLLYSCNSKNEGSDNVININLDKEDKVSVLDLVDSISVVQLETKQESLFNFIVNVIFYKDRFYILDLKLQSILCFDAKGKYLYKINKKGRGPDEYSYIESFNIDPFNNQLMLLVPWGDILYYNLDGEFISKVKLPEEIIAYNEVYALDKERLLFISLNEVQANYYSRKSNTILKGCLQTEDYIWRIFSPLSNSYYYRDSLYFSKEVENIDILNMSDNNLSISYSWDFGEKKNKLEKIKETSLLKKRKIQNERKPLLIKDIIGNGNLLNYFPSNCFENERYRISSLFYKDPDKLMTLLRDKKEKKNYAFRKTTEGIQLSFRSANENSIIMHSDTKDKIFAENTLSPEQLKIVRAYNPDKDNPFLVIYHLKQ